MSSARAPSLVRGHGGWCARLCVGLLVVVLPACGDDGAALLDVNRGAIYGGAPDAEHGAVVALLRVERLKDGDMAGSCTGTIVAASARVGTLVTAGHCVAKLDEVGHVEAPLQLADPAELGIFAGPDWQESYDARRRYPASDVWIHPDYDGVVGHPFDVAVVRFVGALDDAQPVPLTRPEDGEPRAGSTMTLVGFGETEGHAPNTLRRAVEVEAANVSDHFIDFDQTTGTGTCGGDSGGPALVSTDAGERLAGVTSFGDLDCNHSGSAVNLESVRTFVEPLVDAPNAAPDCRRCALAAAAPDGGCFAAQVACDTTSAPCTVYRACLQSCATDACLRACDAGNLAGVASARALDACLTDACGTACFTSGELTLVASSPSDPAPPAGCAVAGGSSTAALALGVVQLLIAMRRSRRSC